MKWNLFLMALRRACRHTVAPAVHHAREFTPGPQPPPARNNMNTDCRMRIFPNGAGDPLTPSSKSSALYASMQKEKCGSIFAYSNRGSGLPTTE